MVNSINSYSSSATSSYRGLSGLASGMDTEGMIETMMKASNARLEKLYQRQQSLTWKTQGYQDITTALYEFQNKYLNKSATTSLFNPNFFDSSTVTAKGSNAGAVTVTGSVSNIRDFKIYGVSQLAQTSSFNTKNPVTQGVNVTIDGVVQNRQAVLSDVFKGDYFAAGGGKEYSALEGETLKLKMGGSTYTVTLEDVKVGATPEENAQNIKDAMNNALAKAGLKDKVTAELDGDGKMKLNVGAGANTVELYAGGDKIMETLGLTAGTKAEAGSSISGTEVVKDNTELVKKTTLKDLNGQSLTLDLDGVKRTITFNFTDAELANFESSASPFSDFVSVLNNKVKDAFGGKVQVTGTADKRLAFTAKDSTAILSVASGSNGVTGNGGFLGIDVGDANRLLQYNSLSESGVNLNGVNLVDYSDTATGEKLTVNGTTFEIFKDKIKVGDKLYDFDKGVSVNDIVSTVNNAKVGATIKYNATSDGFSVVSTESGALGKTEVSGGALAKNLFGASDADRNVTRGQDAIVRVSMGGNAPVEVVRNSNNFTMDGMNISLNKTFDSEASGGGDAITFTAQTNSDEVVKNIKEMVDSFNELIKTLNKAYSTKPDKDYQPLTTDQKKEMSEDEIKAWNEKASAGTLFGDSLLQGLVGEVRFAFSLPVNGDALSAIGIKSSTDWTQNGTLTVDESALKAALEADPDRIKALFTGESNEGDGASSSKAGVMSRMQSVMDKYISTTGDKGLLINRAGHKTAPLSLSDNAMYKEMKALEDQVTKMKASIKTEQDRYHKQFSYLETYINQMNAQSSWLSQQLGG